MKILLLSLWLFSSGALACGFDRIKPQPAGEDAELYLRFAEAPVAVGELAVLQVQFCRDGKPLEVSHFKLDADMPAHGHGMNYRARPLDRGAGRYDVEGLLFHMPGNWRVRLEYRIDDSRRSFEIEYEL